MRTPDGSERADSYTTALAGLGWLTKYTWSVRVSERARKPSTNIAPTGSLEFVVPVGYDPATLARQAAAMRTVIGRAAAKQKQRGLHITTKDLVAGEGFPFMGRRQRLHVVAEQAVPVQVETAPTWSHRSYWLSVRRDALSAATIIGWYRQQGQVWMDTRIPEMAARIGVPAGLTWQVMPYTRPLNTLPEKLGWYRHDTRTVALHWMAFQMPREWVDYLGAHEVAHAATPGAGHSRRWESAMDALAPMWSTFGTPWRELRPKVKACQGLTLWLGAVTPTAVETATREVVRVFQRYTSEQRADRAASHRMGHQQRQAVGEFYFTHPAVPGRAFSTRRQAAEAAVKAAHTDNASPQGWGTLLEEAMPA